jgi:hypothetical protein
MADRNVCFLNALGIARGDVDEEIHAVAKLAAGFAGHGDEKRSAAAARFDAANDVHAAAAGGQRDEHVAARNYGFDLARENGFDAEIVAGSGEYGSIRREREASESFSIDLESNDEFGREMLGIGCAAAISEVDDFFPARNRHGRDFGKSRDIFEEFLAESFADGGAFTELTSNFFDLRAHRGRAYGNAAGRRNAIRQWSEN